LKIALLAMMAPKRILIADDHEVVRAGLRVILQAREGWEVVAEADNGKDAIALIVKNTPDVAIIDYALPLINGIEVTRSVKQRQLDTQILIFTMHDSDDLMRECFRAGARAFLLKSDARLEIVPAVEALLANEPYLTGIVSEKILASYLATNEGPTVSLRPRERMIIQLISEGYSNKEVSKLLNLSVKTVETHRSSAMKKLSIKSTAGLVRYAVKNKLIEP
jgi:DNA-binding NarL/FixJ family response regulator